MTGLSKPALVALTAAKVLVLHAVIGIAALTILLNQYTTRRAVLSRWLVAATVIVVALVGGLWRWPFLG